MDATPVDTDVVIEDTDVAVAPVACSVATPTGVCPGAAACEAGRCLIDLDPGTPAEEGSVAEWDAIASYIGDRELLFDVRPIDWSVVSAEAHDAVAAAPTAFGAAWAMSSAVARLQDGHTALRPPAVCDVDPGFSGAAANTGACVVESEGELVVVTADEGVGWRRGDVLLDIDGRIGAELVADRLAQPRCRVSASTSAGARASALASLMWRGEGEAVARVRRGEAEVTIPLLHRSFLACTGRVGVAAEQSLLGKARTATLEGGVDLVVLAEMGASDLDGFHEGPLLDALREHYSQLAPHTPLLIDVRGNGGGFRGIAVQLGAWLLPPGTLLWRSSERGGDAPDAVITGIDTVTAEDALRLDGPVAVLSDGNTYGAAEFMPLLVQDTGRGIVVGEPSSGSYGQSWAIPFGSQNGAVNASRCERPDGAVADGDPLPADLAVTQSPADARVGVDTVVEAARVAVLSAALR